MKPMTAEAVKRLALANGGSLHMDGRAINSARLQVAGKPQPATDPVAYMLKVTPPAVTQTLDSKPDPVIREAVLSIDNYAASQFLLNEANANLMQTVKDVLQKVAAQEPEKRPTKWVFKVKRDAQGLMETITATAT